ncbi:hypothetical protein BBOV_III000330 [Babesia bovis T2Bo]|uniref:RNA-editing substrate-binding complex 6 protein domain-containing protein n=1 Tax=Babesia bovis TaxID=5865 RepID=A7AM16_BABBO|nr:hypothetical protein BBOV_III000330 [Babesia bovis T2Bo]EDO07600.1 hypothetical protein BBOV_III000330 [Babesia bovis T2Bo]|eukprot:XP_001611168.1 hypothetical protein [Babesia bovis T2Bo]
MKLPFLLNSALKANSLKDVEAIIRKLEKLIPKLQGAQVSNVLNILSKKEIEHDKTSWFRLLRVLLPDGNLKNTANSDIFTLESDNQGQNHLNSRIAVLNENTEISNNGHYKNDHHVGKGGYEYNGDARRNIPSSPLYTYEIKDVIIVLNAFAKVDVLPAEFMQVIIDIVKIHISTIGSREISTLVHRFGKHNMIDHANIVLENYRNTTECLENETDYSMMLTTLLLNKEKLKSSTAYNELIESIDAKSAFMSDKSLAILVNSLAKSGHDEHGILTLLVPLITRRCRTSSFDSMAISQIANGVARLNYLDEDLMKEIALRSCQDISKFSTRCKVTILNAFHKLNVFNYGLFKTLIRDLESCNTEMTPQCIANTVAAVAYFSRKLDREDIIPLFKALHRKVCMMKSLEHFTIQNQVNILNGFSKVGIYDPEIYNRISSNIMLHMENIKPIDLAIMLNVFARAKHIHPLAIHLCENVENYLCGMKPQEITCCISSINQLRNISVKSKMDSEHIWVTGIRSIKGFLCMEPNLIACFRPLDIRLVIVSLSESGIVDQTLYALLLRRLEHEARNATIWDLVCIFSSLIKDKYPVEVTLLDAIDASLPFIGKCKRRGKADMETLKRVIEQMGISHPLIDKLN